MNKTIFTRGDYLAGKCTHQEYYKQIGDLACIGFPLNHQIVLEANSSKDKNYNDIPLHIWDNMAHFSKEHIKSAFESVGDTWSMAGGVCVMKEAVRQAVEKLNNN